MLRTVTAQYTPGIQKRVDILVSRDQACHAFKICHAQGHTAPSLHCRRGKGEAWGLTLCLFQAHLRVRLLHKVLHLLPPGETSSSVAVRPPMDSTFWVTELYVSKESEYGVG